MEVQKYDRARGYRVPGEKAAAHRAVKNALRRGDLQQQACEMCGRSPEKVNGRQVIHAHHDDYSKPLDVRWLCAQCHGVVHRTVLDFNPVLALLRPK